MDSVAGRALAAGISLLLAVTGCSAKTEQVSDNQIVVIGDSYTTGPKDDGTDPNVWPAMVWRSLRGKGLDFDARVSGEGGAGYAHPGYRGGVFADKAGSIGRSTDLVVFFGSANDIEAPPEALPGAVRSTLKHARLAAPASHLLVIGPAWPFPDPPPEVWKVRDVVRDEAAVVRATFVDPLAQRWLWDNPNLIGPDGIHPNRTGQQYLADRIGPLIEAEMPPPRT